MINRAKILVVDDELEVLNAVSQVLLSENYSIQTALSAEDAMTTTKTYLPDLVICDINLSGMSGIDYCKWLKSNFPSILLMFLSGLHDEFDKVLGLELGAEDYITKPFSSREFKARVKVALRRLGYMQQKLTVNSLKLHDLEINISQRKVQVGSQDIALTKKEFDILVLLASRPGQVFTRDEILHRIWEDNSDHVSDRTVDVHIGRLRDKIEEDIEQPKYIETVRGIGYRFCSTDND